VLTNCQYRADREAAAYEYEYEIYININSEEPSEQPKKKKGGGNAKVKCKANQIACANRLSRLNKSSVSAAEDGSCSRFNNIVV
jgi:hypothetical protein